MGTRCSPLGQPGGGIGLSYSVRRNPYMAQVSECQGCQEADSIPEMKTKGPKNALVHECCGKRDGRKSGVSLAMYGVRMTTPFSLAVFYN